MSAVTETKEALEMWPSCAETRRFRCLCSGWTGTAHFMEAQRFESIRVYDLASLARDDRSRPLAEVERSGRPIEGENDEGFSGA